MSGLILRELTVNLGGAPVLSGVSFELKRGQVAALIGPNGAGKTTCLKAILGLVGAQAGAIEIEGRAAASFAPRERARMLAYLPQAREIAWPLSVANVVALGRHPHAREGAAAQAARVAACLAAVGLGRFAARDVRTLSGGELELALIARALCVEAPILLADEPVASLDIAHQIHVMELLQATARKGAAVLVVLHDLGLAARYCDKLLLLDHGRILASGASAAVLADPALEAAFGVRLIHGEVDGVAVAVAHGRRPANGAGGTAP
jgi:iron complex transport system ATP-binding protein